MQKVSNSARILKRNLGIVHFVATLVFLNRNRRKASVKIQRNRPLRGVATKGTIPEILNILLLFTLIFNPK